MSLLDGCPGVRRRRAMSPSANELHAHRQSKSTAALPIYRRPTPFFGVAPSLCSARHSDWKRSRDSTIWRCACLLPYCSPRVWSQRFLCWSGNLEHTGLEKNCTPWFHANTMAAMPALQVGRIASHSVEMIPTSRPWLTSIHAFSDTVGTTRCKANALQT